MGSFHYYHISTLPRLHYIVWCRLPDAEGNPGKEVRPALVRGIKRDPSTGRGALYVSYGTQSLQAMERSQVDLIIQNFARLDELDLPTAVRFDLGLFNWLPWCEEFFQPPDHSIYVVAGPLTEDEKTALRNRLRRRGVIGAL